MVTLVAVVGVLAALAALLLLPALLLQRFLREACACVPVDELDNTWEAGGAESLRLVTVDRSS
jgi:hypothetical protein